MRYHTGISNKWVIVKYYTCEKKKLDVGMTNERFHIWAEWLVNCYYHCFCYYLEPWIQQHFLVTHVLCHFLMISYNVHNVFHVHKFFFQRTKYLQICIQKVIYAFPMKKIQI